MCKFLSAIVTRDGRVLSAPEYTDSHEDLIAAFGLRDNGLDHFCRVEYTPKGAEYDNLDSYVLRLDEDDEPSWWAERKDDVEAELRHRIEAMIVREDHDILLGGCWIIASGTVKIAKSCTIRNMYGTSSVGSMYGTSSVGSMSGTSRVGSMYGTSSVGSKSGTSSVGSMSDTSSVGFHVR